MTKTLKQNLLGIVLGSTIVAGFLCTSNYSHHKQEQYNVPEIREAKEIQRVLKRNPSSIKETENVIQLSARYYQLLSQDKTLPLRIDAYGHFESIRIASVAGFWSFLLFSVVPNAYSLARRAFRKENSPELQQAPQ